MYILDATLTAQTALENFQEAIHDQGLMLAKAEGSLPSKITLFAAPKGSWRKVVVMDLDLSLMNVPSVSFDTVQETDNGRFDAWISGQLERVAKRLGIEHKVLVQDLSENTIGWRFLGYDDCGIDGSGQDNGKPWNPHLWKSIQSLVGAKETYFKGMLDWAQEAVVTTLSYMSSNGLVVLDR